MRALVVIDFLLAVSAFLLLLKVKRMKKSSNKGTESMGKGLSQISSVLGYVYIRYSKEKAHHLSHMANATHQAMLEPDDE